MLCMHATHAKPHRCLTLFILHIPLSPGSLMHISCIMWWPILKCLPGVDPGRHSPLLCTSGSLIHTCSKCVLNVYFIIIFSFYYSSTSLRSGPYWQGLYTHRKSLPWTVCNLNSQYRQKVGGETEAQRGEVTCPRKHSESVPKPRIEPWSHESQSSALSF